MKIRGAEMSEFEGLDIYSGTRQLGEVEFTFHEGKAALTCSIAERWTELLARTIKCGASWKRTIRSRLGVSKADQLELESSVKGSLGIASVASLESMIQGKVSGEVRLENSRDWEEEYQFNSPDCGRRIIKLYQQQRIFDFAFRDLRPFRKITWRKSIESWLDRVHDGSKVVKFDSECGCDRGSFQEGPQSGRFLFKIGNMSLLVEPEIADEMAYLAPLNARVPLEALSMPHAERRLIRIERRMIPQHLLFLSGDEAKDWTGELLRVDEVEEDTAGVQETVRLVEQDTLEV